MKVNPLRPPGGAAERGRRERGLRVDHDDLCGERGSAGVRGRGGGGAVGRLQAVREDDGIALLGGPGTQFSDVVRFTLLTQDFTLQWQCLSLEVFSLK